MGDANAGRGAILAGPIGAIAATVVAYSHSARCTVVIVNTAVGDDPVARRRLPRGDRRGLEAPPHLAARSTRIGTVVTKSMLKTVLRRDETQAGRERQAKLLREALEELGPTFAKIGQILSTRPDLLPPEFITELATLQDHVPALSEVEVVEVMEQELGVPWEDVFESIDPEPLAAASIGQVHRATLTSGDRRSSSCSVRPRRVRSKRTSPSSRFSPTGPHAARS